MFVLHLCFVVNFHLVTNDSTRLVVDSLVRLHLGAPNRELDWLHVCGLGASKP